MRIETPASRATDPGTSYAAERAITRSGRRRRQMLEAAAAVEKHPGLTSADLAVAAGMDRHALGKRLPEALTAGMVKTGAPTKSASTDRRGVTWWPAGPRPN